MRSSQHHALKSTPCAQVNSRLRERRAGDCTLCQNRAPKETAELTWERGDERSKAVERGTREPDSTPPTHAASGLDNAEEKGGCYVRSAEIKEEAPGRRDLGQYRTARSECIARRLVEGDSTYQQRVTRVWHTETQHVADGARGASAHRQNAQHDVLEQRAGTLAAVVQMPVHDHVARNLCVRASATESDTVCVCV
eukprot:3886973-Rhodomonas_salina.1